jgi:hypothetical protein
MLAHSSISRETYGDLYLNELIQDLLFMCVFWKEIIRKWWEEYELLNILSFNSECDSSIFWI